MTIDERAERDRYQRFYGLRTGNPYVSRTLNPLARPEDRELLIDLAGFPPLDRIDDHIDGDRGSAAFLLTGRNATGRTSLANAILHRYAERKQLGDSFLLVVDDTTNHESKERVHELLGNIRNAAMRRHREHATALSEAVPPGRPPLPPEASDLQMMADNLAYVLTKQVKPAAHLGLLIEGMQDASLLSLLEQVFEHVETVVVMTHKQYGTKDTASLPPVRRGAPEWALRIQLPPLGGRQVRMLTEDRWRRAADTDCPFELDGIHRAFDGRAEPVGTAMEVLRWLLDCRLASFGDIDPWPVDSQLGLPGDWIESMIKLIEHAPVTGARGGGRGGP